MTRTNIKKLYLGVYTKDGEHIPVRLISLIATPDNKWRGGIRKDRLTEKCHLENIAFYTLNGKAVRGKSIRKNNDSIGIIISNYEISENGYDTAAFHEYDIKEVDNILLNTTLDHYSNEETAKVELLRSERMIESQLPYERSIEGIAHYGYCVDAQIIGDSERYPGCKVLQRKYALIDVEFAQSIIFDYCERSLIDNNLLEGDK